MTGVENAEEQEEGRSGAQRREDSPERAQRDEEKPQPVVVQLAALELKGEG